MNHTAIERKIEELRLKCKMDRPRFREVCAYIPDDLKGDNNHLLLLMNIYTMIVEMGLDLNRQRAKIKEFLGVSNRTIWTLNNYNAKILQRSLVPEYQLHLRAERKTVPKTTAHQYELLSVVSGETIGFDDLKAAINQGYFYDGMNSNVKVLSVDGAVYRIFMNGTMFEPVDLREWK